MSEPSSSAPRQEDDAPFEADDDLQFDHAEYTTPAPSGPSCVVCKRPIADLYYEISGKVFCGSCQQGMEAAFRGGSRLFRVLRALFFGSMAAAAGAVLYYVILRATGYNIGLVAVVVGLMVGGAVRKGTGNRGGRFYQLLAVFLTYSAIVAMHVPFIIEGNAEAREKNKQAKLLSEKIEKDAAKAKTQPKAQPKVEPKANPDAPPVAAKETVPPGSSAAPKNAPVVKAPAKDLAESSDKKKATGVDVGVVKAQGLPRVMAPAEILAAAFVAILFLIGLLYTIPVQIAMMAPISGLIFGFALWEAWKINKGVQLSFNGPFRVTTAGSIGPAPEDVGDGG